MDAIERQAGLRVVWASAREVVVWKPAGMASELSNDVKGVSALERVRRAGFARAKLPHRLDRLARGLLLIALDDESIAHHGQQIMAGAWGKWYMAQLSLRAGVVAADLLGEHKAYIKRVKAKAELVRSGGQPARLAVLACEAAAGERWGEPTKADALIQLETGRYHQIRAMMAGLGGPLRGDALYGGGAGEAYLEHFVLRFVPCGEAAMVRVCAEGVGQRPAIARAVWERACQVGEEDAAG